MKKLFLLILILFTAGYLSAQSGNWTSFATDFTTSSANQSAGSDGTQAKPWIISSAEELAFLAAEINAGSDFKGAYIKIADEISEINLGDHYWIPMGTEPYPFDANFDGNLKPIKNMFVDSSESSNYQEWSGLFGWVEGDLSLRNISIESGKVTGGGQDSSQSGALIGILYNDSQNSYTTIIENCHIKDFIIEEKVNISSYDSFAGGIIGVMNYIKGNFTMKGCSFDGVITQNNNATDIYAGGIIGALVYENMNMTIENCHSHARITASNSSSSGGLIGAVADESAVTVSSLIQNNLFTGTINGNSSVIGGLIGDITLKGSGLTVKNNLVYILTNLPKIANTGRIAGKNTGATLTGNYAFVTCSDKNEASLDGDDWTGLMAEQPVAGWADWTKDNDPASLMPYLANGPQVSFTGFNACPSNPTPPTPPVEPVVNTIKIPVVEGATTYPAAGEYLLENGSIMTLLVFLPDDYDQSDVKLLIDGDTIYSEESKLRALSYTFLVPVTTDMEIKVVGIEKNNPTGIVESAKVEGAKVWTSPGHIHVLQDVVSGKQNGVRIYTMMGRLVFSSQLSTVNCQLPSGLYLVVVGDTAVKVVL